MLSKGNTGNMNNPTKELRMAAYWVRILLLCGMVLFVAGMGLALLTSSPAP